MQPNVKGALLMMGSMLAFTVNDTCIKATDGAVPLFQLLTLRGVPTVLMLWAMARYFGTLSFSISRRDWGLVGLRCAAEIGAAYFFLTALMNMQLANISAILQVLPLTVTLGAALFFREAVGWRRMMAILAGFAGMLLIVRPGPDGFSIYSFYALAAVLCVTVRDLTTRRMSAQLPSLTVTLLTATSIVVFFGMASLTAPWVAVDRTMAALILSSSVFVLAAYFFSVHVMRVGDVSFVAPFRYSGLLFALLLGWAVFGDWPDSITMTGAVIIVASGLFTLYRERALLKS